MSLPVVFKLVQHKDDKASLCENKFGSSEQIMNSRFGALQKE